MHRRPLVRVIKSELPRCEGPFVRHMISRIRPFRLAWNVAAALSALLCAAFCILYVRSFSVWDYLELHRVVAEGDRKYFIDIRMSADHGDIDTRSMRGSQSLEGRRTP